MPDVYIFSEKKPQISKVGTSTSLHARLCQARCHTPRGIIPHVFFGFPNSRAARDAEAAAKRALRDWHRPGDATEWFELPPSQVEQVLVTLPEFVFAERVSGLTAQVPSQHIFYDDWREQRTSHVDYKWRLFLFRELSPERRLKLSYGALYDTCYRYAFTYNPYPVRVIAGFDDPALPEVKGAGNRPPNERMRSAWQECQRLFGVSQAEEVGWLNPGVSSASVSDQLARSGFAPFDLRRARPQGAPERESSLEKLTPYGAIQPMRRVAPCAEIY